MKQKDNEANLSKEQNANKNKNNHTGHPLYPTKEDIYSKWKEEKNINPEDVSKIKLPTAEEDTNNEKNLLDDISESDLDALG